MALYEINWLNVMWGAVGGILLTLAVLNVVLAIRERGALARGHFLLAALATAAVGSATFELLLASASTPDQFGSILQAAHIPITLLIVSIPWFVVMLFRAGRPWLALVSNALWVAAAAINFLLPHSRLYREITDIERVSLFGGTEFTWVSGPAHPAAWLGYMGVFAALVFVLDAAYALWRRDEHRRAIIVGVFLGSSLAIGLFHSMLVESGVIRSPYIVSLGFLIIMVAMAAEVVGAAARAPVLAHRVEVQQAEVAHLSRNTMLGEISGGLAHELSQPLNAILNNAQSAVSFLDREPPDLEEVREALMDIAEQDRHACEVVSGFAQLVKSGDRSSELVNINQVVEEVLDLARKDLARSDIEVAREPAPEDPLVQGDRVLLSVIVYNLIRNAAEAVTESDCEECAISVSTLVRGGLVDIEVTDTGPGIPEESREEIFEAFFTTRGTGTGLGLSVSRTLAGLHGGSIRASAGPNGCGTSMRVTLPISDRIAL